MNIVFYTSKNDRSPVYEFIKKQEVADRAKILACLKNIEDLGFNSPRVSFRQIKGKLWEVKIQSKDSGYRIFYVGINHKTLVLLHAYKKQSQKAPKKEIIIAENRLQEVLDNEKTFA